MEHRQAGFFSFGEQTLIAGCTISTYSLYTICIYVYIVCTLYKNILSKCSPYTLQIYIHFSVNRQRGKRFDNVLDLTRQWNVREELLLTETHVSTQGFHAFMLIYTPIGSRWHPAHLPSQISRALGGILEVHFLYPQQTANLTCLI